jgi:hypothetical protein
MLHRELRISNKLDHPPRNLQHASFSFTISCFLFYFLETRKSLFSSSFVCHVHADFESIQVDKHKTYGLALGCCACIGTPLLCRFNTLNRRLHQKRLCRIAIVPDVRVVHNRWPRSVPSHKGRRCISNVASMSSCPSWATGSGTWENAPVGMTRETCLPPLLVRSWRCCGLRRRFAHLRVQAMGAMANGLPSSVLCPTCWTDRSSTGPRTPSITTNPLYRPPSAQSTCTTSHLFLILLRELTCVLQ